MPVRRIIYLDKKALEHYATPNEGGALTDTETTTKYGGSGSVGVNAGFAEAKFGGNGGREHVHHVADTPATMFSRLLDAVKKDTGWKEITHPERQFPGLEVCDLISWNCDLHIPDVSHTVARSGDGLRAIDMVQKMVDMAEEAAPDNPEVAAKAGPLKSLLHGLSNLVEAADARRSVVGDSDHTAWKVVGSLTDEHIQIADVHDIDGRLTIVGQIAKLVPADRWHPLVVTGLINRPQRRKLEIEGPRPEQEKYFLRGPAIVLDILAIYR